MSRYDDILFLEHPTSSRHLPMPLADRGAQFSPFAALTGYEEVIRESARLTDSRVELVDEGLRMLNEALNRLLAHLEEQPRASFTLFVPDRHKDGGSYVTCRGRVRKFDPCARTLTLTDDTVIPLEQILQIQTENLPAGEVCPDFPGDPESRCPLPQIPQGIFF